MTQTDIANLALSKIGESLIDSIDDTGDRRARLAKLHYEPSLREILRAHFWGFAMTARLITPATTIPINVIVGGALYRSGALIEVPRLLPTSDPDIFTSDGSVDAPGSGTWFKFEKYAAGAIKADVTDLTDTLCETETEFTDPATVAWTIPGPVTGSATVSYTYPDLLPWFAAFAIPADFIKLRSIMSEDGAKIDRFDFRRIGSTRYIVTPDFPTITLDYVQYVSDPAEFDPLFSAAFVTLLAARLARAISGSEKAEADLLSLYQSVDLPAARTADGHDSQSNENHPLQELVNGSLTGLRSSFFPEDL